MLPVQFGFGPIIFSTFGFFVVFSFVVASFLLWRTLREDYPEEEIITLVILATLFALIGARIFYLLDHFTDFGFNIFKWLFFTRFPGFSLVGGGLVMTLFLYYYTAKKKWDFWLMADQIIWAALSAFLLGSIGSLLTRQPSFWVLDKENLFLGGQTLLSLVFLGVTFFLARNYRKIIWYQSGKPGFVACTTTALFFLIYLTLDFFVGDGLYWEVGGALTLVSLAIIFLYRRSGRFLKEDLLAVGSKFKRKQ